jgi:hypothetical protein
MLKQPEIAPNAGGTDCRVMKRISREFIALRAFSLAADSPLARPECPLRQLDYFAMAARPPRKQLQVLPFSSWIVKVPSRACVFAFVTVRVAATSRFALDLDSRSAI